MANEGLHCGPRKAGRGRQALIRVKPISANVNEKWLLVLGTIRAALALALQLAPEAALAISIDNLSLTRIEYFPGAQVAHPWRVTLVNQPPL